MGQNQIYSTLKQINKFSRHLFTFIELIGSGTTSNVWKVQFLGTPKYFALKEMIKSKILMNHLVSNVLHEKEILSTLYHPFIINMYCSFHDKDYTYLILEYYTCGDLRYQMNYIETFTEEQIRFFAGCALLSLEYLRENNIIHLDIKPENFICDSKGYFHLSDFGNARKLSNNENSINTTELTGTPHYMSPEMIMCDSISYTSDYFCLGIILYELITGSTPLKETDVFQMKHELATLNVKLTSKECGYSSHLCGLVNDLLQSDPNERLEVNDIKLHPFFNGFNWKHLFYRTLKSPFIPKQYSNNVKYVNGFNKKELLTQNERFENYMNKNHNGTNEKYYQNLFKDYQYVHLVKAKLFTRFYNEELVQKSTEKVKQLSLYSPITKHKVQKGKLLSSNNSNRNVFSLKKSGSMPKIFTIPALSCCVSPLSKESYVKNKKFLFNNNKKRNLRLLGLNSKNTFSKSSLDSEYENEKLSRNYQRNKTNNNKKKLNKISIEEQQNFEKLYMNLMLTRTQKKGFY